MNKSILAVAVAGALLAHTSIQATEQAPPSGVQPQAAAVPIKSTFIDTVTAAAMELAEVLNGRRDAVQKMEAYSKFEFSPALRPKLKEVFGTERPLPLQRANGAKGQVVYTTKLPAHSYLDENAVAFSWAELTARMVSNKAGSVMNTTVALPSLAIIGPVVNATVKKMNVDFKQARAVDGVWYGGGTIKLGTVVMRATAPGSAQSSEVLRLEDSVTGSSIARHGKKADLNYAFSIKSILFGGDHVDRANIGLRVVNMPAQALADMDQELRNVQISGLTPQAQTQVTLKSMASFGKSMVMSGASVMIDDISASYHGNTASIKGRVDFDKVAEADFSAPMAFARKIVARLDLRLPVGMVNDVSRLVAGKQVDASAPNAAEQRDMAAKNIAGMVIGKLVNEGFAVMDKGELRSAIEIKGGKITFNGKTVPLPGMPNGDLVQAFKAAQPAPVAAPAPTPASAPVPQ